MLAVLGLMVASAALETESPAYPQEPGVHLMRYCSRVDRSWQRYTLYLPRDYGAQSGRRYPLVFFGVGYGGTAGAPGHREWADRQGWIFAGFDGRRYHHYYGVAEADFDQVLHEELAGHYPIDLSRVYFIGSSMGASGALGLGFRHPDWLASVAGAGGFVDYDEFWPRWNVPALADGQWPTHFEGPAWQRILLTAWSPVHTVESGFLLAPYIAAGERDGVNRPWASRRLAAGLAAIGAAHRYVEVPGGGHGAGFDVPAMLDHFRTVPPLDPWAPEVRVATNRLEFGRNRWVRLTALASRAEVSVVRARARPPNRIQVETHGPVRGVEVTIGRRLWPAPPAVCMIEVDGRLVGEQPVGDDPIRLHLRQADLPAGQWTFSPGPEPGRKSAGVEGPINHVFATPFVVVYGASGSAGETAVNREEAIGLARAYKPWCQADLVPVADTELTEAQAARHSLVLIGTEASNRWLERLARMRESGGLWPLALTRDRIAIRGLRDSYTPTDHGVLLVHPSPWGGRYVLASHGVRDGTLHRFGCFSLFALPDYAVFSRRTGEFLAAGLLDEDWQLPAGP